MLSAPSGEPPSLMGRAAVATAALPCTCRFHPPAPLSTIDPRLTRPWSPVPPPSPAGGEVRLLPLLLSAAEFMFLISVAHR